MNMNMLEEKEIIEVSIYEEIECIEETDNTEYPMILKEPRSNLIIGILWTLAFFVMALGSLIKDDFRTALWCIPFWILGMLIIISYVNFLIKYNDKVFIFRDSLRREHKFLFKEVEWFKDVTDYWEFKMPDKQINLTVNVLGVDDFVKKFPENKKAQIDYKKGLE